MKNKPLPRYLQIYGVRYAEDKCYGVSRYFLIYRHKGFYEDKVIEELYQIFTTNERDFEECYMNRFNTDHMPDDKLSIPTFKYFVINNLTTYLRIKIADGNYDFKYNS